MTIQKTTEDLSTLRINRLSQQMYDDALENDQINATELYLTDYDGVDSTELPTSAKIAEFDSSAKMNSTDMTSEEITTLVNGLSFKNDVDMTQEELQTFLSNLNLYGINAVDYIVEQGTNSGWFYRKWNSGKMEAWLHNYSAGSFTGSVWVSPVRYYDTTVAIPSGLFNSAPSTMATSGTNQWWIVDFVASSKTSISMRIATLASSSTAMYLNAYAYGTWK